MDTRDFRKPRPDVPILPSRAVFRTTPLTVFKRPKGRKGRKVKGRPKTTQAQTREFLQIKQADEARKSRELAIKKARDTEARETESLALQRERLRQDRDFRQQQLQLQDFVSRRDFIRAERDRQQNERGLFLQAQIAQAGINQQQQQLQQQAQIAQQQQQQQLQIANQRGQEALQDRQLREREIGLRQQQLEFGRQREEDEDIFRARQVAQQQQNEQLQQTLEDRRQREARAMFQYFQQTFVEGQRREGERQAQFAQLIADSKNKGSEVTRDDFRNLQEQVEKLTPKSRPSPQEERRRETTDLRFRSRSRESSVPPEDQEEFNDSMDRAFREATPPPQQQGGVAVVTPRSQEQRTRAKAFARSPTGGGGSVRLSPQAQGTPIAEIAEQLEAESPESGLEETPATRTRRILGSPRLQAVATQLRKVVSSPAEQGTEEEKAGLLTRTLTDDPTLRRKLKEQTGIGTFTGEASPRRQPTIPPVITAQQVIKQVEQPRPEPEPELEPEPEPTLAEQVGGAVAGVVGTTAGVVSNVGLGVARGVGGAIAESLPTAGQVGEAIGRAGVGGVKAVGGAVAGGLGAFLEEPEPAPVKVEKTPYEQLLELRASQEGKFSLSRKPRGAEFGTFERGDSQFVLRGEIKKGLKGDFAIHTIDPKKKSVVYKDLSKPEAGGREGGFGSTTFNMLDKRIGLGALEVSKRIIGEEEEAQP